MRAHSTASRNLSHGCGKVSNSGFAQLFCISGHCGLCFLMEATASSYPRVGYYKFGMLNGHPFSGCLRQGTLTTAVRTAHCLFLPRDLLRLYLSGWFISNGIIPLKCQKQPTPLEPMIDIITQPIACPPQLRWLLKPDKGREALPLFQKLFLYSILLLPQTRQLCLLLLHKADWMLQREARGGPSQFYSSNKIPALLFHILVLCLGDGSQTIATVILFQY